MPQPPAPAHRTAHRLGLGPLGLAALGLAPLGLIVLCCLIEALLLAADAGLIGAPTWRQRSYENAGFWAGLLRGWRPNYLLQPGVMFFSHAFLHTGPLHLLGNMAALAALANLIGTRMGQSAFLALWMLSALAGGLAFGLLSPSAQPMVGTSGALFGLTGALVAWEAKERGKAGQGLMPVLGWILVLALLNLAFWLIQRGSLAWESHLGGFALGLIWGGVTTGQPRLAKIRS